MTNYLLVRESQNSKTGPIPVSISVPDTCPTACPLKGQGCYAQGGPLGMAWRRVEAGKGNASGFEPFLEKVRALPDGQLWRHNQAGDLPGTDNVIDSQALAELVSANQGRRGFTYTHKPVGIDSWESIANARAVERANVGGFTVNLSADSLAEADSLADLGIGPVAVVLPESASDASFLTPAGRTVVICPAQTAKGEAREMSCAECQLCAIRERRAIVGFKAHSASKRRVSLAVVQRDAKESGIDWENVRSA